jgi:hypothetical protein
MQDTDLLLINLHAGGRETPQKGKDNGKNEMEWYY